MNKVHLIDCMEFMKDIPDKYYELAIIDPPYGSENIKGGYTAGKGGGVAQPRNYHKELWNQPAPTKEYFQELIRISNNQIVWGANHFISKIPYDSSCWIVWDKDNGAGSFADCELAWTSFNTAVRKFKYRWQGMLQEYGGDRKEQRIHPTQKPVALYKWLLKNYAKPGDKIFDSHVGSGSIRIACHDMGFDFEGCEIDKDYWEAQEKRYNQYAMQGDLFSSEDTQKAIYQEVLF
jgi:site-specific DNA-methyltransferase (adenine-specific)